MSITAQDVQKLRASCSVGMMEAKKALTEAGGDFDKAVELLRKQGSAKAAKKADREMSQGRVHSYIHGEGRIGVLVEISCETDFVARNEAFVEFCNDVAMHTAAMSPIYLTREEIPAEIIAKEVEIVKEQNVGKPEQVMEKIVEGKLEKYYEEMCLVDQKFIKDEDMTIAQLVESKILSIGENIKIKRFCRFELGV
ncbi:translation elongation factor Ts [Patescibacteria group bacterium]|nr:translation elongation factor Ts [Patescibacteria group bacterium]MBU4453096.1 translation elongation factor Ts [Patescibacteria group bacterium]MCG2687623.1 translation elongation factor Ts [Candidatus Parcubacteria bacterium]